MNSETKGACGACGCSTTGVWTGKIAGNHAYIRLCHDCVTELTGDEIDDYGEEFPEETRDDLMPRDLDD